MTVTVPIQVRLDHTLVKAIDARAASSKMTRAEVLRDLLATAFATPPTEPVAAIDPLFDRILDAVARLDAKLEECGETSRAANINAFAAYATARLHALKVLPQDQQAMFVSQLGPVVAQVVQP